MKAYEYCKNAATTMEQRGKENGYDNAKEERSAKQIAAVFNALTGRDLTEQEAWTFLICLKLVRQHRKHQEDNIVDLVAYAALLGESHMTVHDEIQVDTTTAQYDSLKGVVSKLDDEIEEYRSKVAEAEDVVKNFATTPSAQTAADVVRGFTTTEYREPVKKTAKPLVTLHGEDGTKIQMTVEDFRNMEKTLVRSALE